MTDLVDTLARFGGFALPAFVYAGLRLLRFSHAVAIAAGAASVVLLAAGCRTPALPLAALALGLAYRDYSRQRTVWPSALALGATTLVSATAALWAALSALYFLYPARRPLRTLRWLGAVFLLAFALPAAVLLPRLATEAKLSVPVLSCCALLAAPAVAAGLWTLVVGWRSGGPDHRLLFLAHSAVMAGALLFAAPAAPSIRLPSFPIAVAIAISLLALILTALTPYLQRRVAARPAAPVSIDQLECEFESAPPRWGGWVPACVIAILVLSRIFATI
jgi:hypothetical protein